MTTTIEHALDLKVPVRTAYDQWTQFKRFPEFLPSVKEVEQIDDRHIRWHASIGGESLGGETEICEQIPDKRVAWRALSGPWNSGVATFHRIDDERSRVMLQLEYRPEQLQPDEERIAGMLERELEGFKGFIEARGEATGAWRGEIPNRDER